MKIYEVIRTFGLIHSMYINRDVPEVIVVFKKSAHLETFKPFRAIRVDGKKWKIRFTLEMENNKAVRPQGFVAQSLETPAKSPYNILNALNDDCLRPIFKHEVLDIEDLCNVANACERFKWLAIETFRRKYKGETIVIKNSADTAVWQWRDCLDVFGKLMKSITIEGQPNNDMLRHLVDKYCPNIGDLMCSTDAPNIDDMCSLFSRLNTLTLFWTQTSVFDYSDSVTEYELGAFQLPPTQLTNLVEFNLICGDLQLKSAEAFFAVNPQLQRLQIGDSNKILVRSNILHCLRHLPNLQKLRLFSCWILGEVGEVDSDAYDALRGMKQLKHLTIEETSHLSRHALESMIRSIVDEQLPLEYFSLTVGTKLSNILDIGNIKTITSLVLGMKSLEDDELISIVENLPHLTDFLSDMSKITMHGVKCFVEIAHPSMTAQFVLNKPDIDLTVRYAAAIDQLLLKRGVDLGVVLQFDKELESKLPPVSRGIFNIHPFIFSMTIKLLKLNIR